MFVGYDKLLLHERCTVWLNISNKVRLVKRIARLSKWDLHKRLLKKQKNKDIRNYVGVDGRIILNKV